MAIAASNSKEINRMLHILIQIPTLGYGIQSSVHYQPQDTFALHLCFCVLPTPHLVKVCTFKLRQDIQGNSLIV